MLNKIHVLYKSRPAAWPVNLFKTQAYNHSKAVVHLTNTLVNLLGPKTKYNIASKSAKIKMGVHSIKMVNLNIVNHVQHINNCSNGNTNSAKRTKRQLMGIVIYNNTLANGLKSAVNATNVVNA